MANFFKVYGPTCTHRAGNLDQQLNYCNSDEERTKNEETAYRLKYVEAEDQSRLETSRGLGN
jgi:hypothetical protein